MYTFYVLQSQKDGRLYKGHTQDLLTRVDLHNSGNTVSTKAWIPWVVIYSEEFPTREDAIQREKEAKTRKGGRELRKVLKENGRLKSSETNRF